MAVIVTVPKILRQRLTDEGADALVEVINKSEDHLKEDVVILVEEKFERRLAEEIGKLRVEMGLMRSEIIKWMFIFWIGQFASIVGVLTAILFAFFK